MNRDEILALLRVLQEWIIRIERASDDRSLRRVLALLCSAYDELALIDGEPALR